MPNLSSGFGDDENEYVYNDERRLILTFGLGELKTKTYKVLYVLQENMSKKLKIFWSDM